MCNILMDNIAELFRFFLLVLFGSRTKVPVFILLLFAPSNVFIVVFVVDIASSMFVRVTARSMNRRFEAFALFKPFVDLHASSIIAIVLRVDVVMTGMI